MQSLETSKNPIYHFDPFHEGFQLSISGPPFGNEFSRDAKKQPTPIRITVCAVDGLSNVNVYVLKEHVKTASERLLITKYELLELGFTFKVI